MSAILSQVRVRRYLNCNAFFVLVFVPAPGRLSKERFRFLAAFGRKDKAERFAQERATVAREGGAMTIQRNDRNDLIDASAGIDRLRRLLCDQGSEWICPTLAMICGEHEADCTPGSPLEIAWRDRGRAFEITSRKMTKITAEARRVIPRLDEKEDSR